MFVGIGLLVTPEIQNQSRKIAVELDLEYKTGLQASLLPQHISLTTSFKCSNLSQLEKYYDAFVDSIFPFQINFTKVDVFTFSFQGKETGLVWLDVKENEELRKLHNQLNRELQEKFDIHLPVPDNDIFHFHSTVVFGNESIGSYPKIKNKYDGKILDWNFKASEAVMFYSPKDEIIPGSFITYKIKSIG